MQESAKEKKDVFIVYLSKKLQIIIRARCHGNLDVENFDREPFPEKKEDDSVLKVTCSIIETMP